MDTSTSEIFEMEEEFKKKVMVGGPVSSPEIENIVMVERGLLTPKEIKQKHADFENFCKIVGINPNTSRQTKRKAEKLYAKALKKLAKQRKEKS